METLWFWLVALMLIGYVVFDGFDLGVGAVHLWAARTTEERRLALRTIGPVWDGNEVWLLAAGGTLYFAFPRLYASSFSGFYLPLMIALWLLILRGIAIEFRNHLASPVWAPFWDRVFFVSSLLLAIVFGAALGNVVRGVPLQEDGTFFVPLWTDFGTSEPGVLDWYTVSVGLLAAAALAMHGALWLVLRTDGALKDRSSRIARGSFWIVLALTVLVTALTLRVQPLVWSSITSRAWGIPIVLLSLAGLGGVYRAQRSGRSLRAFLASCCYLGGMLASAAFGLYPNVLPAMTGDAYSLTVHNSASGSYGLKIGLAWWVPGMALVALYFLFTYRRLAATVGGPARSVEAAHRAARRSSETST